MRKASLALLILATVLCASSAFAAIGAYRVSATATVPSTISYMLNTDANETAGGWAVKIEIVPTAGGAAVRTATFAAGNAMCARGVHTWIWDGKADGGAWAPTNSYKAVVTAKALPITGTTIKTLWEASGTGLPGSNWYEAAVDKDPASPNFGCVYAVNQTTGFKYVYKFAPDGLTWSALAQPTDGWLSSAPYSVFVGNGGKVYAGSYSKSFLAEYGLDGAKLSETLYIGAAYNGFKNLRFICSTGSGTTFKTFGQYWNSWQATTNSTNVRFYTAQSAGTPSLPSPWTEYTGAPLQPFMQPRFDPAGDLVMCAYADVSSWGGGSLQKRSYSAPLSAPSATNTAIRRGVGLTYSPDGNYVWISRYVSTTDTRFADSDQTAIYKLPVSSMWTVDPAADGSVKFAIDRGRAYTLDADSLGNLVAPTAPSNAILTGSGGCGYVGVYAPPDSGSTDVRETAAITHTVGEYAPVFIDGSATTGSGCLAGSTITATVHVSDDNGYLDVGSVLFDRAPFGVGLGTLPMNRTAGAGTTATYAVTFSTPAVPAGVYHCPVLVNDVHGTVVTGYVDVSIADAWISGVVKNSVSNAPIAGATVTAVGVSTYTATSGADGSYIMTVSPDTYAVKAHKDSHNDAAAAVSATVACGESLANIDVTLDPLTVDQCTGHNNNAGGRAENSAVCVIGNVFRTHEDTASAQKGLNGYYYIYDYSASGTTTGARIQVFTGQEKLVEGDRVVVDGTWNYPVGIKQGRLTPTVAPFKVSHVTTSPTVRELFASYVPGYLYGGLYHAGGAVTQANATRFAIGVANSTTDPTLVDVWFAADTLASTGLTVPAVGSIVDVWGVLSGLDSWGNNCLTLGKVADIGVTQTVNSLGDALKLGDGGVIIDCAAKPVIVTFVDNASGCFWVEAEDRSAGLKVIKGSYGAAATWDSAAKTGSKITHLAGQIGNNAILTGGIEDGRALRLSGEPTVAEMLPWPAFIGTTVKTSGGAGKAGLTVLDQIGVPAVGLSDQGMLATIAGKVVAYEEDVVGQKWMAIYVDDGSNTVSDLGHTGIKVIRPFNPDLIWDWPGYVGRTVRVSGISCSRFVTATPALGRIRMLMLRVDSAGTQVDSITTLD